MQGDKEIRMQWIFNFDIKKNKNDNDHDNGETQTETRIATTIIIMMIKRQSTKVKQNTAPPRVPHRNLRFIFHIFSQPLSNKMQTEAVENGYIKRKMTKKQFTRKQKEKKKETRDTTEISSTFSAHALEHYTCIEWCTLYTFSYSYAPLCLCLCICLVLAGIQKNRVKLQCQQRQQ